MVIGRTTISKFGFHHQAPFSRLIAPIVHPRDMSPALSGRGP